MHFFAWRVASNLPCTTDRNNSLRQYRAIARIFFFTKALARSLLLRRRSQAYQITPTLDRSGLPAPELVILKSPYRKVITPILNYIWQLEAKNPKNTIAVLIPQLVESRWYYSFLHNRRAAILRTVLLLKGRNRIVIINVPWNLEKELPSEIAERRAVRDRVRT